MPSRSVSLTLQSSIVSCTSYNEKTFIFLNLSHTFEKTIDWNFSAYGRLWTYNLTYFDYLQQKSITKEAGMALVCDFIEQAGQIKEGLEPFAISLRAINWVKFLTRYGIKEQTVDDSLYAQYNILLDNLEYHLLGNHLLENGFSLLFGAYYFQDERIYVRAKTILMAELDEQILADGAHFELSPMYHQIMLYRVLDCVNLVQNNDFMGQELLPLLREKAEAMFGWLDAISYEDGTIPLFNDSANGIAPTTRQLETYSRALLTRHSERKSGSAKEEGFGREPTIAVLGASGYLKVKTGRYECVVDVGDIGPDYIPGHAHADTFNFELRIEGRPFIVDTGLSSYESGARRDLERGTAAHNTVEVAGKNSSGVWESFRVAERAKIVALNVTDNTITATHDGYRKTGIYHTRQWTFENGKIVITDRLNREANAVARLHFHPDVTEEMINEHINIRPLPITEYQYAPEFNRRLTAKMAEFRFEKALIVEIKL